MTQSIAIKQPAAPARGDTPGMAKPGQGAVGGAGEACPARAAGHF